MNIIPFTLKKYEIDFERKDVLNRIKQNTIGKTWKIGVDGMLNNSVFVSEVYFDSFIVVIGRYGLSYGRTSLLPVLKGSIVQDKEKKVLELRTVISLFNSAIVMMLFVYAIVFAGIIIGIYKSDVSLIGFSVLFFAITYGSIMLKFNKEKKVYIDFLETTILTGNFRVK